MGNQGVDEVLPQHHGGVQTVNDEGAQELHLLCCHNQWSMVRSMNRARSDAGAATLKGNIYVVGEFDGVAPTNAAEVFCPGTGRWSMISPMRVARSGVKVVAMNSKLGGFAPQLYTLHHTGTPELELGDWKRTEGERLNK